MGMAKQKTISREFSLSGTGLHSGAEVNLKFRPAAENAGITFVRTDIASRPSIKLSPETLSVDEKISRCTALAHGDIRILTVEHLLAAVSCLGIDNLTVEIDGDEVPGMDGSSKVFFSALKNAGIKEESASREYFEIKEPIGVYNSGASILAVPDPEFRISYTLSYPQNYFPAQFFSTVINAEIFEKDLAECRTFCLGEEAEVLKAQGFGKGANYENTLVIGPQGVINNTFRFPNELARHKVVDLIGDLGLLGRPIKGHFIAVKSGHGLNVELLKRIKKQHGDFLKKGVIPRHAFGDQTVINVEEVMKLLPHRYPFLLVDRIIALAKGKKAVGIKNVTINDGFFQGHFPTRPIMPGVLMVEALAQVGGILVLADEAHADRLALFMATDKVKFRRMVVPGDQLVLEVEMVRDRSRTATMQGRGWVGEELAVEAEITVSFVESNFLG